jgi:branched-chain amino acid transport system substrate-binding protein
MRKTLSLLALVAGLFAAPAAQADITIGFVTSLSGNGSSIGIPYGRGINAAYEYKKTINGETIRLIQLDDGYDPSAATRNARKLVEEEKVDLLIGTATAPSTIAMAAVASELKVPMIPVSPIGKLPDTPEQWVVSVPQPASPREDRGRPHETRRHEEHRLCRLLRCLGRPRLQRRQGRRSRR